MARLALPFVTLVALAYALHFHDQGIVIVEEGMILAEAEAVLEGAVMYRDVPTPVAPGAWYTAALAFALFGPDLNATRVLMALLFAATAGLVFALGREVATPGWALLGVACLAVQKVFAFPLGVILFYTEFAIFLSLLAAFFLLRFQRARAPGWLAAAGLAVALCGLFKQNIGAASLVGICLFAARHARQRRELVWLFAPAAGLTGAVLAAFALQGALADALHSLIVLPFTAFRDPNRIEYFSVFSLAKTAEAKFHFFPSLFGQEYLFPPRRGAGKLVPWVNALVMAMYALPVLLFAWAALRFARGRLDAVTLALWVGALGPMLGVYPRSDFSHLTQSLVGCIPLGVRLASSSRAVGWLRVGAPLALLPVAAFAALLVWKMPFDTRFEHPRAQLTLTRGGATLMTRVLDLIEREVPEGEAVAFLPSGAIFYFLADRPLPWGFTLVMPHAVGHDGGAGLRDEFERVGLRWVFQGGLPLPGIPPLEAFAPELQSWLDENFEARPLQSEGLGGARLLERIETAPRG